MNRDELGAKVVLRAIERCEYCLMHQHLQGATFHVEHIVPEARGGQTELANLALACPSCNLQKSDRQQATDSESGQVVPLFHPREQQWSDHFQWYGYLMVGKTPTGRATIDALDLNHERRLRIRRAEELFDLFPPS